MALLLLDSPSPFVPPFLPLRRALFFLLDFQLITPGRHQLSAQMEPLDVSQPSIMRQRSSSPVPATARVLVADSTPLTGRLIADALRRDRTTGPTGRWTLTPEFGKSVWRKERFGLRQRRPIGRKRDLDGSLGKAVDSPVRATDRRL